MQCQQATNDPRLNPHDATMRGLIDAMKSLDLNNYSYETYSRGLRHGACSLQPPGRSRHPERRRDGACPRLKRWRL